MNVTLERPSEAFVPTLDLPQTTTKARPAHVGIKLQAQQPLKQPIRPPILPAQASVPPRVPPPRTLTDAFRQGMDRYKPRQAPKDVVQTFSEFANPSKQLPVPPSEVSDDVSDGTGGGSYSEAASDDDAGSQGNRSEGAGAEEYDDVAGDYPSRSDGVAVANDPHRPSEGFRTLDEEKTDILCKLHRLKRQGIAGLRSFGVNSDVREMRAELIRIRGEIELEASVKWQRKMLMALTSSMEYANKRWNPLDLQLEGWSEQICESVTDYDQVFERLHTKYKGKFGGIPPEAELLLMVSSSAFVFHLTNTMFKNKNLMENPQFMEKMAQAMAQQQAGKGQDFPAPPSVSPGSDEDEDPVASPQQGPRDYTRREIRGPPMDFSSFLGGAMPPMGFGPPMPQPTGPSSAPPRVQPSTTLKRAAPPAEVARGPPSLSDIGSDRLSDIISEDLASLPDDFSDASDVGPRVVTLPSSGKGRGRASKKAKTDAKKTVLMI